MKKFNTILMFGFLFFLTAFEARADGITTSITANNTSYPFAILGSKGPLGHPYKGCVNIYGTWNSATVAYSVSTDDGTTKVALKNLSGNAYSSTANDSFCFSWGWPNNIGDRVIFYASTTGGTPTLTLDLFDNR